MAAKNTHLCKFSKDVALMAGGELGARRLSRTRSHLTACLACSALRADLEAMKTLAGMGGGLEKLAGEGFRTVVPAVRARVQASPHPQAAWRPLWPVLAPVAGVALMAGFLMLAGGVGPRPEPGPALSGIPQAGPALSMSSMEDTAPAVLTIDNGPDAVHRVAVSLEGPDFSGNQQVFEVTGNSFIDPTPLPAPGQVVFFRVD